MTLVYSRWQLKPGADRARLGDLMLDYCRWQKSTDGVRSARYFWPTANTIATLTEYEKNSYIFATPADAAVMKLGFAISDLADQVTWENWADARAGTDNWQLSKQA